MDAAREIKERVSVFDLASQATELRKSGAAYKGKCPFHSEKTASFVIYENSGVWRCFGACNEGGDIFKFVMRQEKVDFKEAFKRLARRAGVELRPATPETKRRQSVEERIYRLNELASEWFQTCLASDAGAAAREYLGGRGLDAAVCRRYGVGFAPSGMATLRDHLRGRGFDDDDLRAARLANDGAAGGMRDFFSERITIEIRDARGKLIGFGARKLDGDGPKYLNTPQTAVFNKQTALYGINLAGDAAREQRRAVIVEGYTDVISAHERGFRNVMATMGVALGGEHLRALQTLFGQGATGEVVVCLDADQAGQDAALRSLERIFDVAAALKLRLRVARLTAGKDPDELIRSAPREWREIVDAADMALDFMRERYALTHDLASGDGRVEFATKLLRFISRLGDDYERDRQTAKLADQLQVDRQTLFAWAPKVNARRGADRRFASRYRNATPEAPRLSGEEVITAAALSKNPQRYAEDYLLKLLLNCASVRDGGALVEEDLFADDVNRRLFALWRDGDLTAGAPAAADDFDMSLDARLKDLQNIKLPECGEEDQWNDLNACVGRLKEDRLKRRMALNADFLSADGADDHVRSDFIAVRDELKDLQEARDGAREADS